MECTWLHTAQVAHADASYHSDQTSYSYIDGAYFIATVNAAPGPPRDITYNNFSCIDAYLANLANGAIHDTTTLVQLLEPNCILAMQIAMLMARLTVPTGTPNKKTLVNPLVLPPLHHLAPQCLHVTSFMNALNEMIPTGITGPTGTWL